MAIPELALLQSQLRQLERSMSAYLEERAPVLKLEQMVACMRSTYAQALEQARADIADVEFDAEVSSHSCQLLV
jgi:hypothetical protein